MCEYCYTNSVRGDIEICDKSHRRCEIIYIELLIDEIIEEIREDQEHNECF